MESFQTKEAKNVIGHLFNSSMENKKLAFDMLSDDVELARLFKDALIIIFYFEKQFRLRHYARQVLKKHDLWEALSGSHEFLVLSQHAEAALIFRQSFVDVHYEAFKPYQAACAYFISMESEYLALYEEMLVGIVFNEVK